MNITFEGQTPCTWTATGPSVALMGQEASQLPDHWHCLDWYEAVEDPCLIGDDLLIAPDGIFTYVIFDSVCIKYQFTNIDKSSSIEDHIQAACLFDGTNDDEVEERLCVVCQKMILGGLGNVCSIECGDSQ